jgi:hypothetical protein
VVVALLSFVAALVAVYCNQTATKPEGKQHKPSVKILENGQWHESWVYGLQNNLCHSVTVQSGLEALN